MKAKIFVGPPESGKSRVARIIAEHVGKNKTVYLTSRYWEPNYLDSLHFAFERVTETTELLIIDDCHEDFDFSKFLDGVVELPNNDFGFNLLVHVRGKRQRIIAIPQLIFITYTLSEKWKESVAFMSYCDIVKFPLNKYPLTN